MRIISSIALCEGPCPPSFARPFRKTLRLKGHELFCLSGIKEGLAVGGSLKLHITREDGSSDVVDVVLGLENAKEIDTLRSGGLLLVLLHELADTESTRVNADEGADI